MNGFDSRTLAKRCYGTGYLECSCMGDGCCCDFHGSAECFGCPDCEWDDEEREEYRNLQEEVYGDA